MKKYPIVLIFIFGVIFLSCEPSNKNEDLLLIKSTIYTQENQFPTAEAMVVKEGKIIAIGTWEMLQWEFPDAPQLDLSEKVILPGFIDSHAHNVEFGEQALKANLEGCLTVGEMIVRLKKHFPNPEKGKWLLGYGWDEGKWADLGYPDRKLLDEAFPNNPIALKSLHGFAGFYNGKALEIAGINTNTPQPTAGRIIKRPNGEPSGVMETIAQQLVNQHIPKPDIQDLKKAILAGLNQLMEKGVTMVHEAGLDEQAVVAYLELDREGKLPIHVYIMLNGNDDKLMQTWFEKGSLTNDTAMAWVKGAKVFYDGSLGSRTALLFEPYSDHPHLANMTERISQDKMKRLIENCLQYGFQPAVHAIGDSANQVVAELYRAILMKDSTVDHRWRIEHAQAVGEEFYKIAAENNFYVSMQSSHAVGDSPWAEDRLGNKRIQNAYAWNKMLANNIPFILNSDLPGEPWEPMQTLYFAVTRKKLGDGMKAWYPNQAISVEQAIQAMTIDGAKAAFAERITGSLRAGKYADFVVLSKNPYQIDADSLQYVEVEQVFVKGRRLK